MARMWHQRCMGPSEIVAFLVGGRDLLVDVGTFSFFFGWDLGVG